MKMWCTTYHPVEKSLHMVTHNGIREPGRGALAIAGGDDVYAARASVADIVRPAGDVESGSFANGCTVESRRRTGDADGEDPVAPDTKGTCPNPPLGLIATRHDRDFPPDPYTSGFSAHSRRKAFHTPTAAVAPNNPTGGARAAPKTAFANGAVSTIAADFTGEVDARSATVGDAVTFTNYITVGKATPDVTCDTAPAAVTDAPPPLDGDAALDAGGGTGDHNTIAVNDQTGATAAS